MLMAPFHCSYILPLKCPKPSGKPENSGLPGSWNRGRSRGKYLDGNGLGSKFNGLEIIAV